MCVHGRRRFLPDLSMLSIFDALPLYKLLKTDRVCPRFAQLRAEALANRKMLTIFIGENVDRTKFYRSELFFEPHLDLHTTREAEKEMAEHSALEVETLNQESINWLKSSFPRVTKLRLIFGLNYELAYVRPNVIQLLGHWAEKLESFGIWAEYQFDTAMYLNLFQYLFYFIDEKLHSLQYLTIDVPCYEEEFFAFDVSFLSQLKFFSTRINPALLLNTLKRQSAILRNIPEIRLFYYNFQETLLEMPPRLTSKITALLMDRLTFHDGGIDQLTAFFGRFPALKWYRQLSFNRSTNIGHFFLALSQLSHLTFLELDYIPVFNTIRFNSQQDLQPLSTLETLFIKGHICDRHFLGQFDRLFPALKCIKVDVVMCKYSTQYSESAPIRKHLAFTKKESKAGRTASQAALKETVSALMLTFAQMRLKGSLIVSREYIEELFTRHHLEKERISFYYKYTEVFNFADFGQFEEWQYAEENVTIN